MTAPAVTCARCDAPLLPDRLLDEGETPCPRCGWRVAVRVFPALIRAEAPAAPAAADVGEAVCFHHPARGAVAACVRCGRFVCALCEVSEPGGTLCPGCFAAAGAAATSPGATGRRMLYDSIALRLAVYPIFFFPLTIITAPLAVWFGFRGWGIPAGMLGSPRLRSGTAIVLGGLQCALWIYGLWAILR